MFIKPVENINFTIKRDRELIAKLNAVAPYESRNVHDLVRVIILKYLNDKIEESGIEIDYQQLASAAS